MQQRHNSKQLPLSRLLGYAPLLRWRACAPSFPNFRTFATDADPHDLEEVELTRADNAMLHDDVTIAVAAAAASPLAPFEAADRAEDLLSGIPGRNEVSLAAAAAFPLAPAEEDAANHEEELLRLTPEKVLLTAPLLDSCPPLVAAIAPMDRYS